MASVVIYVRKSIYKIGYKGGSPGLVVTPHVCKVVGSNPGAVYCMDILTFFDIEFLKKIVLFAWKDRKYMKKRPGQAHF